MTKMTKSAIAATGVASLLALAGCSAGGSEAAGDSALSEYDLSGVSVSVGSKDFDEQLILGYIMVEAFEAAGAEVTDRVNLGGTNVAREALVSGEIDVYMEYNGTGWTVHLGNEDPSFDPEELTTGVAAQDLEENGIVWVGRSPFNNTYGFASSPEATEANGESFTLQTMMEYVQANPDAIVCMESEFPSRPDGLVLTETAANNCDFGEVFTTDGRIPALNLTLVQDPGVNILYNVSANIRQETYNEAPEAFDGLVEAILSPLDNERMAELNARVSAEGEDPQAVAQAYLVEEGLLSE